MAFCCSPLKSVCIGPPENFIGIYGLSAVFAKAQLISSLGYVSVEVRPTLFSLPVSQRFRPKLLSGMRNINRTPTCCYGDCSRGWSGDPGAVQGISILHVLQPYQRQKSALCRPLGLCLRVVKFLISKDKSSRTVVHSSSCPKASCTCPKRLEPGQSIPLWVVWGPSLIIWDVLMILTQSLIPLWNTIWNLSDMSKRV